MTRYVVDFRATGAFRFTRDLAVKSSEKGDINAVCLI